MIVQTGRWLDLLFFIVILASTYYFIDRAGKGKSLPKIRAIPAIEAIEEGVDRAVETDKLVHFASGASGGQLSSQYLAQTLASLECLKYTAQLCARKGAKLSVTCPTRPESLPLIEAVVRDAYRAEGKPEAFNRDMIKFYGSNFCAYCQGVSGYLAREGCAANINIGAWHTDCLVILGAAKDYGAINIGGTARWIMMYAFGMFADYMLVSGEIFAAGALVSANPVMKSGVAAEDIGKFVSIALTLLVAIVAAAWRPIISLILEA